MNTAHKSYDDPDGVWEENDKLRAENERLRAALDELADMLEETWSQRDIAPDSELEAVERARHLVDGTKDLQTEPK